MGVFVTSHFLGSQYGALDIAGVECSVIDSSILAFSVHIVAMKWVLLFSFYIGKA